MKASNNIREAREIAGDCYYRATISGLPELAASYLNDSELSKHINLGRRLSMSDFNAVCETVETLTALETPPNSAQIDSILTRTKPAKVDGFVWQSEIRALWNRHRWNRIAAGKPEALTLLLNPEQCTISYEEMRNKYGGKLKELHGNFRDPPFDQQYQLESPHCMVVLYFSRDGAAYLKHIWFYWNHI